MATYTITAPDGHEYDVTAPDSATQDEVLAYAKTNYQKEAPTDWKKVVGQSLKDVFHKPAAFAKDLGTNPESMANALPALGGAAGSMALPWGGTTAGTAAGQGVRDMALSALGKPVPGVLQHGMELGTSVLGELAPIPALKKSYFGKQIGQIEKAAGVPAAQDIPSLPMATGQKSLGEFINDAVTSVKSSNMQGQPAYWKQIKDQVDRIYEMGKNESLTTLDKGRLKWLSNKVQEGLNASVPGRAAPASALGQSQAIPRLMKSGFNMLPQKVRSGVQYGTGVLGPALAVEEVIRRLLGK